MKKIRLHLTIFLQNKFKQIMKAGISAPITLSGRVWNLVISANLLKVKAPEAACGCYEKPE